MTEHTALTPEQSKAARALLGWSQTTLAENANVGSSTVADFERGFRTPQAATVSALRSTFEQNGLAFVAGTVVDEAVRAAATSANAPKSAPLFKYFTEEDVEQWGATLLAQSKMPELVERLIRADLGLGARLCYPADEGVIRPGWDGTCRTDVGSEHVPAGTSGWEFGTNQHQHLAKKANDDYKKRTEKPGEISSSEATFIFATPRRWPGKKRWLSAHSGDGTWKEVRAYDATDLVSWLAKHAAVGRWLGQLMRKPTVNARLIEEVWSEWTVATKWPFTEDLVLADREDQAANIHQWVRGGPAVLNLHAETAEEAVAFLHGCLKRYPPEYGLAYEARCLVAGNHDIGRELGASAAPLIIILQSPPQGLSRKLVENGHHVYAIYDSDIRLPAETVRLPRPHPEALTSALEATIRRATPTPPANQKRPGIHEEARQLAIDSGGSLSALRRLMQSSEVPAWADLSNGRALTTALLAETWDERYPEDIKALERLYGDSYLKLASELTRYLHVSNPPLKKISQIWKLTAPRDAWMLLSPFLTDGELDRFEEVLLEVLSAPDSRFSMPEEFKRWGVADPADGRNSDELREGLLKTLLLLALFGESMTIHPEGASRARRAVTKLLHNADAQRWWSLSDELRLLAEAAPAEFLDAIQESVQRPDAPISALLADGEGVFGRSYVSNLLWGLEALARDPQYFAKAASILASLAARDTGKHHYTNRPHKSLQQLFFVIRPQTSASLEQRLDVMDAIRRYEPNVAWAILIDSIPRLSGYYTESARPIWRTISEQPEPVTSTLIARTISEVVNRLTQDAGQDAARWKAVILLAPSISDKEVREKITTDFRSALSTIANADDRRHLRVALEELVSKHRRFAHTAWALNEDDLRPFDDALQDLSSMEPIEQAIWLFNRPGRMTYLVSDGPDGQAERAVQAQALATVIDEEGVNGVFRVGEKAKFPRMVGVALGLATKSVDLEQQVLERGLSDNCTTVERELALGLIRQRRLEGANLTWLENLISHATQNGWGAQALAAIVGELQTCPETWDRVAQLGANVESLYWKSLNHFDIPERVGVLSRGIQKLIDVRRFREAVEIAGNWAQREAGRVRARRESKNQHTVDAASKSGRPKQRKKRTAVDKLKEVTANSSTPDDQLDMASEALTPDDLLKVLQQFTRHITADEVRSGDVTMLQFYIVGVLVYLDAVPAINRDVIASIEWGLLPLLEHSERTSFALHEKLSRDPGFFVEALSAIYLPESDTGGRDSSAIDEKTEAVARLADELLSTWNTLPGMNANGSLNESELANWVSDARKLAQKADRRRSADIRIGKLLARAPAAPEGCWPHSAIASVIESVRSSEVDEGFVTGRYNDRGVTGRTLTEGGKQERALANQYHEWARSISGKYQRTAGLLRKLADWYEEDARNNDKRVELWR